MASRGDREYAVAGRVFSGCFLSCEAVYTESPIRTKEKRGLTEGEIAAENAKEFPSIGKVEPESSMHWKNESKKVPDVGNVLDVGC